MKPQQLLFLLLLTLHGNAHCSAGTRLVDIGGDARKFQLVGVTNVGIQHGTLTWNRAAVTNVVKLAATASHGLALLSDRTVLGWGTPGYSMPITDRTASIHRPKTMDGLVGFKQRQAAAVQDIAVGAGVCLVLFSDGHLEAWGDQNSECTKLPEAATNIARVFAGWRRAAAIRSDGTLVAWGENVDLPVSMTNIADVALGRDWFSHNLALTKDGSVIEWGGRGKTKLQPVPPEATNVVGVATGRNTCLALRQDGSVLEWSMSADRRLTLVRDTQGIALSGIKSIAAGLEFAAALDLDGKIYVWGPKPPAFLKPVAASAIFAGDWHLFLLHEHQ